MKSWIKVGLASLSALAVTLGCGDDDDVGVLPTPSGEEAGVDAAPPDISSAPATDAGEEPSSSAELDSGTSVVDADVLDGAPAPGDAEAPDAEATDADVADAEVVTDAEVLDAALDAEATVVTAVDAGG